MTKSFVDGKVVLSFIYILRSENMLSGGYSKKAQILFDKYNPIEVDESLSIGEKIPFMEIWWREHFKLLIESGLNRQDLEIVSNSSNIVIRNKCIDSLKLCDLNHVPFVILSASCIGDDSVIASLKSNGVDLDNVSVISNKFVWSGDGEAISAVKPYIYTFNKSGSLIKNNVDTYSKVKSRKNIILIGDSLGDCNMADGLDYDNILKIGFLNFDVSDKLETYKKYYDVVIINDGEFDFIYDFLCLLNKK